jgi:hypothetical protein
MVSLRFLRFTIFNFFLLANGFALLEGGGSLWTGFAARIRRKQNTTQRRAIRCRTEPRDSR